MTCFASQLNSKEMYSRISNSQTRLWVLTLGIVISLLAFSPPCAPWKASTPKAIEELIEEAKIDGDHSKMKDRVLDLFEGLSD